MEPQKVKIYTELEFAKLRSMIKMIATQLVLKLSVPVEFPFLSNSSEKTGDSATKLFSSAMLDSLTSN